LLVARRFDWDDRWSFEAGGNFTNGRRPAQLAQGFGLDGKKANARRSQREEMPFGGVENALKICHRPTILTPGAPGARQCC
jgi:hypothetical protein